VVAATELGMRAVLFRTTAQAIDDVEACLAAQRDHRRRASGPVGGEGQSRMRSVRSSWLSSASRASYQMR
jgi:hypothetical protein